MSTESTVGLALERGKFAEFARALQIDAAELAVPDGEVIPPTFLTITNFLDPAEEVAVEYGFDLARILHGEQEYIFHGPPPRVGDVLAVASAVTERYEKQGSRGTMRFAVRETEFRDAAGRLVATARMTAIETPDQAAS